MDDIELDNLGDRRVEEEETAEEETNIDTDWRDESFVIIGGFNPVREGLDEEQNADRELGKKLSANRRSYIRKIRKIFLESCVSILTRVMDHLQKRFLKN